jgi:L-alanine-DL-glutamate epimerase-like enolase superfamily enzyme
LTLCRFIRSEGVTPADAGWFEKNEQTIPRSLFSRNDRALDDAPGLRAPSNSTTLSQVKLKSWRFELILKHTWTIARTQDQPGGAGAKSAEVLLVQLTDDGGVNGLGEAAPILRYNETVESTEGFLKRVDPNRLSFADVAGSMKYLETVAPGEYAAKGALNIALLDGAGKLAGKSVHDLLGLAFTEGRHITSFSIGIASPEMIRKKVLEAQRFPVLKLKVGSLDDRQNLAALREAAPTKPIRVDANEAWKTKEEALKNLEWLASDGHVQFIEQPMPSSTSRADLAWLKARSPLPMMGDESYLSAKNVDLCVECYHAVNVKLVKTGGISGAFDALTAARKAGLKTMIGCMIETSVLITAAAHLAELTDYLDIDGNLLVNNDPFLGATAENGIISLAAARTKTGLQVVSR